MSILTFRNEDGEFVTVSPENPLPVSGAAGGGGMTPEEITAAAPATWDPETRTIGVSVGTGSNQVAAGNHNHNGVYAPASHTHTWSEVTGKPTFHAVATSGSYTDLTNKPVAAYVDPNTGTVADVINALIAAGLMAAE